MSLVAVIDTETNWNDRVMSLGVVLGDGESFRPVEGRYYVFTPEWELGGMYGDVLDLAPRSLTRYLSRAEAMEEVCVWLRQMGVNRLFAYNARFDCRHLQELSGFSWYDIMALAAYRQHNPCIPADAPCCSTGRLKKGYGVEPILRLLSGCCSYRETHNAYFDALDELRIMELLGLPLGCYDCAGV